MHTSTSSFNPLKTALATAGALVVFFTLRCFFVVFPNAFVAHSESLAEYTFYSAHMRGKTDKPPAQILLMGTSRTQLGKWEINPSYARPGGHTLNLSIAGNSFWQLAALRRRNPELWDNADLIVMDLLPFGIYLGRNFDEKSVLFLRESTLAEKWLIRDPVVRLRALADWVVPVWSERRLPSTWWDALAHLNDTDTERMAVISQVRYRQFPDFQAWLTESEHAPKNEEERVNLLLDIDYPLGPYSFVQEHALRELAAHPPRDGYFLLMHLPHSDKLQSIIMQSPERKHMQPEIRRLVESVVSDRVALHWIDRAGDIGLRDEDFLPDGVHFGRKGIVATEQIIDAAYRELHRLPPATAEPAVVP